MDTQATDPSERIHQLEAQVAAYEHERQVEQWRREAADKYHLPLEAVRGDSKDDIESCAAAIDAWRKTLTPPPRLPNVPNPAQRPTDNHVYRKPDIIRDLRTLNGYDY